LILERIGQVRTFFEKIDITSFCDATRKTHPPAPSLEKRRVADWDKFPLSSQEKRAGVGSFILP
jgi:hypothetical protein